MSRPDAFFFDRCFPPRIARLIGQFEDRYTVRAQDDDDRFVTTAKDTSLLETLAADPAFHWVFVTQDTHILTRTDERRALDRTRTRMFYCGRAWHRKFIHEQAWQFLRVWPTLVERAVHGPGRIFEIEGANLKITRVG